MPQETDQPQPLPCPFCGAKPVSNRIGCGSWLISHTSKCWFYGGRFTEIHNIESTLQRWNTRTKTTEHMKMAREACVLLDRMNLKAGEPVVHENRTILSKAIDLAQHVIGKK